MFTHLQCIFRCKQYSWKTDEDLCPTKALQYYIGIKHVHPLGMSKNRSITDLMTVFKFISASSRPND